MNETNTKYYKTYRGIYKLTKTEFEIFTVDLCYHISSDIIKEYDKEIVLEYLNTIKAKEISKEEYNSLFDTLNYLREKQYSLYQNIKEFINNSLNG